MKTFTRTLAFVILPALAISSILALRVFAADPPKNYPAAKFVFKADHPRKLKAGREEAAHFKNVLDQHNAVYYCMSHTHKNGKQTPLKKGQCPEMVSSASAETTDTKEFTLICAGAHVTQQAGFNSKADLDAVSAEFE
jgi:hypothetical protein